MDTRSSRTKVETKTIKKKRLNFGRLLVFLLLIYLLVYSVYYIYKTPIKHYEITGNNYVSETEILKSAGLDSYPTIFSIRKKKIKNKLVKNPFISDVEIKYGFNFTVKINIKENKPILYNYTDSSIILADGSSVNLDEKYKLPVLLNNTPKDILKELVANLDKVDDGIISMISEIEYQPSYSLDGGIIDNNRFLLYMSDENLVYVTSRKANLLNKYLKIIATTAIGGNGTLYLDGTEDRYTFVLFDEKDLIKREKIDLGVVSDDGAR